MDLPFLTIMDVKKFVDKKSGSGTFINLLAKGVLPVMNINNFHYVPIINKGEGVKNWDEETTVYKSLSIASDLTSVLGWSSMAVYSENKPLETKTLNTMTFKRFMSLVRPLIDKVEEISLGIPLLKKDGKFYLPTEKPMCSEFSLYSDAEKFARNTGYTSLRYVEYGKVGVRQIDLSKAQEKGSVWQMVDSDSMHGLIEKLRSKNDSFRGCFTNCITTVDMVTVDNKGVYTASIRIGWEGICP
jgi:hypothetical protein